MPNLSDPIAIMDLLIFRYFPLPHPISASNVPEGRFLLIDNIFLLLLLITLCHIIILWFLLFLSFLISIVIKARSTYFKNSSTTGHALKRYLKIKNYTSIIKEKFNFSTLLYLELFSFFLKRLSLVLLPYNESQKNGTQWHRRLDVHEYFQSQWVLENSTFLLEKTSCPIDQLFFYLIFCWFFVLIIPNLHVFPL